MSREQSIERRPLIAYFLQPYPFTSDDHIEPVGARYDPVRQLNVDADGAPLYCSPTKRFPTACSTPGHSVPSGYTRTGKWKPAKYVPAKSDRRAGR